MSKINLAYHPPIADVQANTVFAGNGNVVLGYKAVLPEIYSLSEKDFEDLLGTWFQAIKSLPTGTVVHKQDIYLKQHDNAESLPNKKFLEKATHDYFMNRQYIEHQYYIFFLNPRNKALNNPKFINPFKKL